ncbi:MAG: ATP-dependent Clp protease ATP-binding subunit [Acidobacteria bacterium]|nr:ATP-dependent Clp protease ATP-binding subunit [Acidobacteriota bacterium]
MLEKYSDKARRILFFARNKAAQFSNPYIDTVHILHGILMEEDAYMSRLFRQLNLDTVQMRRSIDSLCLKLGRSTHSGDMPMTDAATKLLQMAVREAFTLGEEKVEVHHIFLAMLSQHTSTAVTALRESGLGSLIEAKNQVINDIMLDGDEELTEEETSEQQLPILSKFGRDITRMAQKGRFDRCIGREREMDRIIHILTRRRKNNPLVLGEAGVGKTAIVEGLATRIAAGNVPAPLKDRVIFGIDIYNIVAGTKYRGQFEERLRDIIEEASANNVILFIDEFHSIVGAGSAEGSLDAANIMKPALARSELQVIGSSTYREFSKTIEKDKSLMRRFQSIAIQQPTPEETLNILKGIKDRYEDFHSVQFEEKALEAAVTLSERYITDRMQPDKAIDLLDETGARVKLKHMAEKLNAKKQNSTSTDEEAPFKALFPMIGPVDDMDSEESQPKEERSSWPVVTVADIEEAVSIWTGIPVTAVTESEKERLLNLKDYLVSRVVGQNRAVNTLVKAIKRARLGMSNPDRPTGVFMFLGPTGVGKTELSKQLATYLFRSEKNLVRFDMSEYMEKHSVSRLIGSPPGYVGYEEGGQLTERVKKKPYSVVLLDEIEKAHPELINVLLQIFDEGRITDAFGELINFRNTIIIMTSNVGSRIITQDKGVGFDTGDPHTPANRSDRVLKEVRRFFAPEFLNRVDDVIVFNPLSSKELSKIVYILINDLNELLISKGIQVRLSADATDWLTRQACMKIQYGARPLKRAIQVHVQDKLSDLIISNGKNVRGEYLFEVEKDHLTVRKVSEILEVKC